MLLLVHEQHKKPKGIKRSDTMYYLYLNLRDIGEVTQQFETYESAYAHYQELLERNPDAILSWDILTYT